MNDLIVFDSESIPKKTKKTISRTPEHDLEHFMQKNVWDPVVACFFFLNHPYVFVGWGHQLRHPARLHGSIVPRRGRCTDFVWVEKIQSFFFGKQKQQRNKTCFSFFLNNGNHIF